MHQLRRPDFFIKLKRWEYWPFGVVYFPIMIYWIYLSVKARSLLYFTASNPGIRNGGMLGESKIDILSKLPAEYVPKTLLIKKGMPFHQLQEKINTAPIGYPLIAKPDVGERGWWVEKIECAEDMIKYAQTVPVDYLIQEYIALPVELGVFYYRLPDAPSGKVSSVVRKEMLSVTGDGKKTIEQLILAQDRSKLQHKALAVYWKTCWDSIPRKGEKIMLLDIGNHCRGAMFLNNNYLINPKLNSIFDELSHRIEGFYFGRFDLRCASEEALYRGEFKIMELNGAGAEPGHIYHPGSSIIEGYKVLFDHFQKLYQISRINISKGAPYLTFKEGLVEYKKVRNKFKTA